MHLLTSLAVAFACLDIFEHLLEFFNITHFKRCRHIQGNR